MGVELTVVKELASVSVTATELSTVARIINNEIAGGNFHQTFNQMIALLNTCYAIPAAHVQGFLAINDHAQFVENFDQWLASYKEDYLVAASKPRFLVDEAYELYLNLQTSKEIKTGYPLLKHCFLRLDHYIDKWINNDSWLIMNIDNFFKMLLRFNNEVAELKKKDTADAFLIYDGLRQGIQPYLQIIEDQRTQMA